VPRGFRTRNGLDGSPTLPPRPFGASVRSATTWPNGLGGDA
jgi:hypothetical protein